MNALPPGFRRRFGRPKYRYSPNAQSHRERLRRLRQASHGWLPESQFRSGLDYDVARRTYLDLVLRMLAEEARAESA